MGVETLARAKVSAKTLFAFAVSKSPSVNPTLQLGLQEPSMYFIHCVGHSGSKASTPRQIHSESSLLFSGAFLAQLFAADFLTKWIFTVLSSLLKRANPSGNLGCHFFVDTFVLWILALLATLQFADVLVHGL